MNAIPWPVLIQVFAPYGIQAIEYLLSLFKKDIGGQPITPEEWQALVIKHVQSPSKDLADAITRDAARSGTGL
jgi:hypothetical protein